MESRDTYLILNWMLKLFSRPLHVFNWGLGVESTAILLRWIKEPETRPFECWSQVIILVAQTGDEYPSTKILAEVYMLPLLRQVGARLVQVARKDRSQTAGYTLLSDTREPYEIYIEGDYKLSAHSLRAGTLPTYTGAHTCAINFKGVPLDYFLGDRVFEYFGPHIGYNAAETKRIKKSSDYGCRGAKYRYPLFEWDWDRDKCIAYIYEHLGVIWKKSCCVFCPFQSKESAIERWNQEPEGAAFSAFMEYVALAFNPKMNLFPWGSAIATLDEINPIAKHQFYQMLTQSQWAIYQVRRIITLTVNEKDEENKKYDRWVVAVKQGDREQLLADLRSIAQEHNVQMESESRFWQIKKINLYPQVEEFYVLAPSVVEDKCENWEKFRDRWQAITEERSLNSLSFTSLSK